MCECKTAKLFAEPEEFIKTLSCSEAGQVQPVIEI